MTKKVKIFGIGLLSFVAAAALAVTFFTLQFVNSGVSTNTTEIIFEIPPGTSLTQIALNLQNKGLIRNGKLFLMYSRLKKMNSRLKVGEYSLNQAMTPNVILEVLVSGKSITRNLTIAEGLSLFDIAEILEKSGVGTQKEFFALAYDKDFIKSLLNEDLESLEGYLFPETYKITKYESIKSIVAQMVKRFVTVWSRYEDVTKQKKWSRNQLITFASIVEKETGAAFERPMVSSVFHNRLAKKMRLQTDPTVIYGVALKSGMMPFNITKADLLTPTRHNTYTNYGLPPTPIANPGEDAIRASLQPANTKFLYFVSRNDGTHVFSENFEKHNDAVKDFQLNSKARNGKSWRDLEKNKVAPKQ